VRSHSNCTKTTAAQVISLFHLPAIELREPAIGSQRWHVDRFIAFCWRSARIPTLRYSSVAWLVVLKSAVSACGGNRSCITTRERPLALLAAISTTASHPPSSDPRDLSREHHRLQ
jgi:hypothetical protein